MSNIPALHPDFLIKSWAGDFPEDFKMPNWKEDAIVHRDFLTNKILFIQKRVSAHETLELSQHYDLKILTTGVNGRKDNVIYFDVKGRSCQIR